MAGGAHPAFAESVLLFFPNILFGNLVWQMRWDTAWLLKDIFPTYLIWSFYKREPSKVPLTWHKHCHHRLKQVLSSSAETQRNVIMDASTLDCFIVSINIWDLCIEKMPELLGLFQLKASLCQKFLFIPTSLALSYPDYRRHPLLHLAFGVRQCKENSLPGKDHLPLVTNQHISFQQTFFYSFFSGFYKGF